jgi:hypothetical protein
MSGSVDRMIMSVPVAESVRQLRALRCHRHRFCVDKRKCSLSTYQIDRGQSESDWLSWVYIYVHCV